MKLRAADYGIYTGVLEKGPGNCITDVPGVKVGHKTLRNGKVNTGVTVIMPGEGNYYVRPFIASGFVHNGFGKTAGLVQIEELGYLETPIALTNTLNVGLVWDAIVEYTIDQCRKEGVDALSISPLVGECNDSAINDIRIRAVSKEDVFEAIETSGTEFEEGAVGAGTGTICYGFKGGIGSSSRRIKIGDSVYTLGVLVQSNFGATRSFLLNGNAVGEKVIEWMETIKAAKHAADDKGSIMMVVATDLPLSSRQLKRVIRRCSMGIARSGSFTGHGSGDVMLGFTTANRLNQMSETPTADITLLGERYLSEVFEACADATHEAIMNSMIAADGCHGLNGDYYPSLKEFIPFVSE